MLDGPVDLPLRFIVVRVAKPLTFKDSSANPNSDVMIDQLASKTQTSLLTLTKHLYPSGRSPMRWWKGWWGLPGTCWAAFHTPVLWTRWERPQAQERCWTHLCGCNMILTLQNEMTFDFKASLHTRKISLSISVIIFNVLVSSLHTHTVLLKGEKFMTHN